VYEDIWKCEVRPAPERKYAYRSLCLQGSP